MGPSAGTPAKTRTWSRAISTITAPRTTSSERRRVVAAAISSYPDRRGAYECGANWHVVNHHDVNGLLYEAGGRHPPYVA